MKHGRGIDLLAGQPPAVVGAADELAWLSFEKLPDWYVLGARCIRCEREAWLDRWALQHQYGRDRYLYKLAPYLRCRKCGNKGNNKWIIGKAAR